MPLTTARENALSELHKVEITTQVEVPDNLAGLSAEMPHPEVVPQTRQMKLAEQLLRLAMKGVPATKAADMVGCCHDTARAYYRKPEFRRQVTRLLTSAFEDIDAAFEDEQISMHEKLEQAAKKSYDELMRMLNGDVPGVGVGHKIKIAQDFLNRNPETQAGSTVRVEKIDAEQLALAAQAAEEMCQARTGTDNVVPIRKP